MAPDGLSLIDHTRNKIYTVGKKQYLANYKFSRADGRISRSGLSISIPFPAV